MEEKLTYSEASQMDIEDLMEANAALDIYIEKIEEKNKNAPKK